MDGIDDDEKYPAVASEKSTLRNASEKENSNFMMTQLELLNMIKHPLNNTSTFSPEDVVQI